MKDKESFHRVIIILLIVSLAVSIYSLMGIRDEKNAQAPAKAMMSGTFMKVRRLRRDKHETASTCWFHCDKICIGE